MTYPSHSIQSRVTRKLSILGLKGPLLPPPLSILLFLRSAINKAESNEKKKICTRFCAAVWSKYKYTLSTASTTTFSSRDLNCFL